MFHIVYLFCNATGGVACSTPCGGCGVLGKAAAHGRLGATKNNGERKGNNDWGGSLCHMMNVAFGCVLHEGAFCVSCPEMHACYV